MMVMRVLMAPEKAAQNKEKRDGTLMSERMTMWRERVSKEGRIKIC